MSSGQDKEARCLGRRTVPSMQGAQTLWAIIQARWLESLPRCSSPSGGSSVKLLLEQCGQEAQSNSHGVVNEPWIMVPSLQRFREEPSTLKETGETAQEAAVWGTCNYSSTSDGNDHIKAILQERLGEKSRMSPWSGPESLSRRTRLQARPDNTEFYFG